MESCVEHSWFMFRGIGPYCLDVRSCEREFKSSGRTSSLLAGQLLFLPLVGALVSMVDHRNALKREKLIQYVNAIDWPKPKVLEIPGRGPKLKVVHDQQGPPYSSIIGEVESNGGNSAMHHACRYLMVV